MNGPSLEFDDLVLAIHAEQALKLLGDSATALQRTVLTCFKTRRNVCYLHSDTSVSNLSMLIQIRVCVLTSKLLPARPAARVAWNCSLEKITVSKRSQDKAPPDKKSTRIEELSSNISVTFDMNKLQAIPEPGNPGSPGKVLVSMNPCRVPKFVRSKHLYSILLSPLRASRCPSAWMIYITILVFALLVLGWVSDSTRTGLLPERMRREW